MLLLHQLIVRRLLVKSGSMRAEMLGDNRARGLRNVGDVLAVFLVGAAVVKNCVHGEDFQHDAIWAASYGAMGLLLLELTGMAGTRLLLRQRLNESLDRGNIAAGVAAAAHYVATGIITSRAVAGSDLRGLWLSLSFFLLGQIAHQGIVTLYRALTTYNDSEQIEGENLAAAISYGGLSVAVAVIVARALEGEFAGWIPALTGFGMLVASALGLFPIRQLVVQGLLLGAKPSLRGGALDESVGRDRNVAAAALEAASYVGSALAIMVLA
jgi:uncharacterized membrane protein YjfL (UPF0719 family)